MHSFAAERTSASALFVASHIILRITSLSAGFSMFFLAKESEFPNALVAA